MSSGCLTMCAAFPLIVVLFVHCYWRNLMLSGCLTMRALLPFIWHWLCHHAQGMPGILAAIVCWCRCKCYKGAAQLLNDWTEQPQYHHHHHATSTRAQAWYGWGPVAASSARSSAHALRKCYKSPISKKSLCCGEYCKIPFLLIRSVRQSECWKNAQALWKPQSCFPMTLLLACLPAWSEASLYGVMVSGQAGEYVDDIVTGKAVMGYPSCLTMSSTTRMARLSA